MSEPDTAQLLDLLRQARLRIESDAAARDPRIAVIGMAGRFPGAESPDALHAMLEEGRPGTTPVSDDALEAAGVPEALRAHPDYVKVWAGFDDPTGFDAALFGYSPREAALLDPQQRVFLECAWAALEHAGHDSRRTAGRIGVFAGGAQTGHLLRAAAAEADPVALALAHATGLMPARVSYHLDLRGPSSGVQTACSTSLVAVHEAVRALLAGDCEMALAGGAAVAQPRPEGYLYQREGIAAPDGTCRPFDAAASGTLFGNGVGAVVLKRLDRALAEGDTIHGVILGSAVNSDGADKPGLTAPSLAGQAAVFEAALAAAGLSPDAIDYVEAHGTGTALGDPVEVAALTRVYGPALTAAGRACVLGSVKGAIGHLDAAAGIAGLIRTLLALRHRRLPGTAHFTAPNPACRLGEGPFRVLSASEPWEAAPGRPRRAAVSSFGMGGTNAHLLVEEAPEPAARTLAQAPRLLPLSARTPEALEAARAALGRALEAPDAPPLADVAHTLATGRRQMAERLVCLAPDAAGAPSALGTEALRARAPEHAPGLAFLFPGQGTQHVGMARALYAAEPAFREAFDACAALLPDGPDLHALVFPDGPADPAALRRTEAAQPALFAVGWALAELWRARGITPDALMGHSLGEYVAACVAGVFSLGDAMRLVAARGRLMQACEPGAMLALAAGEAEAAALLSEGVEIAALNGPRATVLAGPEPAIEACAARADEKGIAARRLATSHAFHSAMMEPALAPFAEELARVTLHAPRIEVISNVTGAPLTAEEATDPGYWLRQLRAPVRFADGLAHLAATDRTLTLELGPGSTLGRLARQQAGMSAVASLPEPGSGADAGAHVLLALGRLWLAGQEVDWVRLSAPGARRVPLPGYAFERVSHWLPAPSAAAPEPAPAPEGPRLYQPVWQRQPVATAVPEAPGRVLLLGGTGLHEALADWPGAELVRVTPGPDFEAGPGGYRLDPAAPEQFDALFAALSARRWQPEQIVNGFGLETPGLMPGLLYRSTLALARALPQGMAEGLLLTLLSRDAQLVTGAEQPDPGAAMAGGLAQVVAQERPGLRARMIDLAGPELPAPRGLGPALAQPWRAEGVQLALRAGFLWQQAEVEAALPEAAPLTALRPGAACLVIGDLVDGLGLVYARALAREHGMRPVLVGPEGLPEPEDWDRFLASHGPHHGVSQLIRALRGLGAPGEDYLLFSGPLADAGWLGGVLERAAAAFGPLAGVFHTAAMGTRYVQPLDAPEEGGAALIAAKPGSLRALERALEATGQAPDFVLVQSSLSVLAGGEGFGPYAAANAALDAFVTARAGRSAPTWQVIDWDACQTHATAEAGGSGLLARAMSPETVWQVSRAVLSHPGLTRVLVTPDDLATRLAAARDPAPKPERTASATPGAEAPRDAHEAAVAAVMGELLGLEHVGPSDNFFELGGHSLLAIQVVGRLRRQFGVDLPMRALLFEAPTVAGIAKVIREAEAAARAEADTLAGLLDDIEAQPQPEPGPAPEPQPVKT
ncbi:type I polyketide synthase [Oceanicella sp. SM1341]|uniref:type I polyketide synthase n=1 Tax=Oceanicella sp. SM1341 TaxID=1548889 RepID=UPI000E47215C|nr:type I polyketide synthase [Oceanicella sp. SM1341]